MMTDKELDEILSDPIFEISEVEQKLFDLPEAVRQSRMKRSQADEVAQRKPCANFADYAHLFAQVRQDLREGRRSLVCYKEDNVQENTFFIADGQMGYIEELDVAQRQIKDRVRKDGRSRVIYEDGTESNILFRTIGKNITRNGYVITERNDGQELDAFLGKGITEEDLPQGWIYVLRSKSTDERIASVENLYKIGFTTTTVEQRIQNARNESTYLMADVEVICTYRVYNVDVHRLEGLIHSFFHTARFHVFVGDAEPEEWFVVPLPIIREAIARFIDGSIVEYTYNREQQALERNVLDTANRVRTAPFDTTGLDVLSLSIKQVFFNEILRGERNVEYRQIKDTTMNKLTLLDKATGKRYVRQPRLLRLASGYCKDRDVLLVEVRQTLFVRPNRIEYHLGRIVGYDLRRTTHESSWVSAEAGGSAGCR